MTAHIRTIKPDFFKDDDIAELSYPARLLFIALWCQADREGRLEYKPKRIKIECLPYDDEDVEALVTELTAANFLTRYAANGRTYLHVRTFAAHQRINQREPESALPAPGDDDVARIPHMQAHASTCEAEQKQQQAPARTQGREGKGREGNGNTRVKRATQFPSDFAVSPEMQVWAHTNTPTVDVGRETAKFREYCLANGKTYKDWPAAWRNWMLNAVTFSARIGPSPANGQVRRKDGFVE